MYGTFVKTRLIPTLSLFVLLLASCAPAAVTEASGVDQPSVQQPAMPAAVEPSLTPMVESPAVEIAPTEVAASAPLPVATSRGPDLEATDPGTVSLASGDLQFVEFFRFT